MFAQYNHQFILRASTTHHSITMKFVAVFFFALVAASSASPQPRPPGPGGPGSPGGRKGRHPSAVRFFAASGPEDDCGTVPAEVMTDMPEKEMCKEASASDKVCMCVEKPKKNPKMVRLMQVIKSMRAEGTEGEMTMRKEKEPMPGMNQETGFMRVCGECEDPCALRLRPDMPPRMKGGMMGKKGGPGMMVMMLLKELKELIEEEGFELEMEKEDQL